MFAVEAIPDTANLYYRVHRKMAPNGPHPGVFREQGQAMSVDWDKYSTPEETRSKGRSPAAVNGVLVLEARAVRRINPPKLTVVHEPEEANRAHSGIHGIAANKTAARAKLFAIANDWLIAPDSPVED